MRYWLAPASLATIGALALWMAPAAGDETPTDPWPKSDLIEPAQLDAALRSAAPPPVICVAFPVLYRQRHIAGARFAGPTAKPEGLEALKKTVESLPRDSEIVIYCGCCPMVRCPNVRPAYRLLKELGFAHVRILELATNFHTDWAAKDYPLAVKQSETE
jgi:thiosulfate/3-mercaptopyruvate sulfurtransferase